MASNLINNNIFESGEVEFRTVDGSNNNLTHLEYGSRNTALLDNVPLDYGDSISTPAGADRSNSRTISNAVGEQTGDIPSEQGLTNLIWAFGQFIDHDLDLVHNAQTVHFIPVPQGDSDLDPGNTGSVLIPLNHSETIEGTGTSVDNPSQLANGITSWLDGSNIYGSDEERAEFLRTGDEGKLKVSSGNLLPFNDGSQVNDDPRGNDPTNLFVAGDVRANENSVLASIQTLFVREHNRLADSLDSAHPTWTDEQIYQRAREVNIAQYQNIVYQEYLPSLVGENAVRDYSGYDSSVNPSITRVFANAAFRFGHSQLSSEILRLDRKGKEVSAGNLTLADVFFQPVSVVRETGIDPILRGVASSLSQEVDTKLIGDVRNLLFGGAEGAIGRDLLAINIERARLNGVADFNTVRESYGLTPVTSFAQITSDSELQSQLASVYESVDDLDPIIGLLAEDKTNGAAVGQTLGTILSDQFTALRDGDRFYYENTFSDPEIAEIQSVTLADIIRRNTNTTIIQDNAFSLINDGTNGNNLLKGGLGNDTLNGNDGKDTLIGNVGDDSLSGGLGNDVLRGGLGIDILDGGAGEDKATFLVANNGVTADLNLGTATIINNENNIEEDILIDIEHLTGGRFDDVLIGDGKRNILVGRGGNDNLSGGEGNDLLRGGFGADTLSGGEDSDVLRGDAGADTFSFNFAEENSDLIADFNSTEGDTIQISASGFGGNLTTGVLDADYFVLGTIAIDASDRFIYNPSTGSLAFDSDGSGTVEAVEIANLSDRAFLNNDDIIII